MSDVHDMAARAPFRVWRFGLGFLCGVLLLAPLLLASNPVISLLLSGRGEVATVGADLSSAGGSRIIVRRRSGTIEETCNGICDDLQTAAGDADAVRSISILDRSGRCLVCDSYIGLSLIGTHEVLTVAGPGRLRIHQGRSQ